MSSLEGMRERSIREALETECRKHFIFPKFKKSISLENSNLFDTLFLTFVIAVLINILCECDVKNNSLSK